MKFVSQLRGKIALKNDTKHDMVCKSVTEIKDHAKNFPNAPRSTTRNAPHIHPSRDSLLELMRTFQNKLSSALYSACPHWWLILQTKEQSDHIKRVCFQDKISLEFILIYTD